MSDPSRPSPPRRARDCRAGVRLVHNEAQGGWVLLAPERVFKADADRGRDHQALHRRGDLRRDRRRPGQNLSAHARRVLADAGTLCAAWPTNGCWNCDILRRVRACSGSSAIPRCDRARRRRARPGDRTNEAVGAARGKLDVTSANSAPLHTPLGLLAELTHRCPLGCPYCSNPLALDRARGRARHRDLGARVPRGGGARRAAGASVRRRAWRAARPRRDHGRRRVRPASTPISSPRRSASPTRRSARSPRPGSIMCRFRSRTATPSSADHIAGYDGAFARKRALAAEVVRLKLPLTVNAVMHRANIDRIGDMVDLALALGASRVEIAHVQYYGWALKNRATLMPTARAGRARPRRWSRSCARATTAASSSTRWCRTITRAIPKPCVGGWGRRSLNVTPAGKVLPCHAAEIDSGPRILERARAFARRHLGELAGLQCLPRHRLDAGAVRELPAARAGFRRLPLPGLRAHRRRRAPPTRSAISRPTTPGSPSSLRFGADAPYVYRRMERRAASSDPSSGAEKDRPSPDHRLALCVNGQA